jgi:hypothetical protein
MPTKKPNYNSRLAEMEAQKRASERQTLRTKRWQQIAFVAVSVIVLLSMILTLFIR